uniref:Uncharacterized protein n=1 Tax=Ascaris lumbricoides TaxID=6252 RepID=A0A0M3IAX0_ASCLU
MKRGFLLDVIVGQRPPIFQLFPMQRYSAHNRNVAVEDQGHDV